MLNNSFKVNRDYIPGLVKIMFNVVSFYSCGYLYAAICIKEKHDYIDCRFSIKVP